MANQTSLDDETKIAARELGRRGGLKTAKKLGKKHYKKMAQKRWAAKG